MSSDWFFLKGGTGRMPAESMADPLRSSYLDGAELFVREALQNSIDEKLELEKKLIIKIKARKLTGEDKRKFVENLQLAKFNEVAPLLSNANSWFKKGKECLNQMADPEAPLRIVEISDHNANGLGGKWDIGQSIQDRFFNLVLSITKTKKQEESDGNSLGSYGFGKMVFALSSNLRTMVYYSRFPASERSGSATRRLMATTFLPSYFVSSNDQEFEGEEYTGHAYFGLNSGKENNPKEPLVDRDADTFFEELGFSSRADGDYGTSVILPACDFPIDEIGRALEKWWWPLLIDDGALGKVSFELTEDDGSIYKVDPYQREELYPYIKAANNNRENITIDKKAKTQEIIIRQGTVKKPGKLSCIKLPKGSENQLKNRVAIIRDKLVIEYSNRAFREEGDDAVGVFYVTDDPKLKKIVTFSEPPAHDTIQEKHSRLIEVFGSDGSDFIRLMQNQIREKCRDFQSTLSLTKKSDRNDVLSFLDEMLGPLIKPRKTGPPIPPEATARIQTIQKTSKTVTIGGLHFTELNFDLGLVEEAEVDAMDFDLGLSCAVLSDDIQTTDHNLRIEMGYQGSAHAETIERGETKTVTLKKDEKLRCWARSQIHPSWVVSWGILLDKTESDA